VPQSWFERPDSVAPRVVMQCDLHHLFTCNSRCNSKRGNRAYYEFRARVEDDCGDVAENRFEPRWSKSVVARAVLYFLTRYPGEVRGGDKEMPAARIATLVRWAKREPPNLWERHRNAEIAAIQGNRNPYIDQPELAGHMPFAAALA
jgi:endonuclease G